MNDNIPVDRQEVEEINSDDLHALAGLTCVGQNEDGDLEWIGSREAWTKYDELSNSLNQ